MAAAHALVRAWVLPEDLPRPADVAPTHGELRNEGGPECLLRKADSLDDLPEEGDVCDIREIPDEWVAVGHVYFHPGTRKPPIPPLADLQAYKSAHSNLPIVVDSARDCESPHLVLARFLFSDECGVSGERKVGCDRNGNPIVVLFTFGRDHCGVAFARATHIKNGLPYLGVDLCDWAMVNFDATFGNTALPNVYKRVYKELRDVLLA